MNGGFVLGNPITITFEYIPGTTVDTGQDPSKALVLEDNGIDDDGVSFIVVTDQSSASNALVGGGKQFFRGDVALGGAFDASGEVDTFGSTTYIHFFDDANGGLLQSITYHTSCSQPIQLGDVIGNATLVGYVGEDGQPLTVVGNAVDSTAETLTLSLGCLNDLQWLFIASPFHLDEFTICPAQARALVKYRRPQSPRTA